MFLDRDATCMAGRGVDLKDFSYMSDPVGDESFADHANARHVLARLRGDEVPRMPLRADPWTPAQIAQYQGWIDGGFAP